MERTNKTSIARLKHIKRKKEFVITQKESAFIFFVAAGFFIGRVLVFEYLNPAMTAYLAVFLGTGPAFYITGIAALLGLVTNIGRIAFIQYLIAVAVLGMVNYYILQTHKNVTKSLKAVIGAVCVLIGGVICTTLNGTNTYAFIICAVESVVSLTLTIIFIVAEKTLYNIKSRPVLNNDQLISISIFMGLCFVGMADISLNGLFLRDVLSITAALMLSYAGGPSIGCSTGLILSVIMFAGAKYSAVYTGILGISGIMGGLFKDFGKSGSSAAFIIGGVTAALYLDRALLTYNFILTFGISVLLFLLIPKKAVDKFVYSFTGDNTITYEDYISKIKSFTSDRLVNYSESFKRLSGSFNTLSDKKDPSSQKELSKLVDKVAQYVCRDCTEFEMCWVKNLYSTYQSIFDSLVAANKRGVMMRHDLPQELRKRCSNQHDLLEIANRLYMVYKADIKWHNRITESRDLVSQQLNGVSNILNDLSRNVVTGLNFIDKYEKAVMDEFRKQKIDFSTVTVFENTNGRIEIEIIIEADLDTRLTCKKILDDISTIIGKRMIYDGSLMLKNGGGYKIKIIEEHLFSVTYGAARAVKDHSTVSGDNYTCLGLNSGVYAVALSDGMGSGDDASRQSIIAIELMEQMLESGFDTELSIRLINSALLLKSEDDFFTTFDMLLIDRYSGVCKSIKIGAVETYLLRDGKVRVLRQSSLPAGILPKLEIESSGINLKNGDCLLIVSDGITDTSHDDNFIENALTEYRSLNPQNMADYIVERAKAISGNKVKDDMTAIVVKVQKNY